MLPPDGTRNVMSLPIAGIAIGERIGFYDSDHALHLGCRMAAEGQHDPIHVKRNGNAAKLKWTLVAGLHRLRGAEYIGRAEIDAIQVADASASVEQLRRLELSENMDHRQRRPIERAIFMVELARLEEEIDHPGRIGEPSQVRAGRARQAASITMMDAGEAVGKPGALERNWRERAAVALGCSVPSLERYQRLHREIVQAVPDLAQALNDHPLGESMTAMLRVTQFCKRDDVAARTGGDAYLARRQLIEIILRDRAIPSVDEAFARLTNGPRKGNRSPADDARRVKAIGLAWSRLAPPAQRDAFAAQLAGTDASVRAFMRAALDQADLERAGGE